MQADLCNANLLGAELRGANLMGAQLYGAEGLWLGRLGGGEFVRRHAAGDNLVD